MMKNHLMQPDAQLVAIRSVGIDVSSEKLTICLKRQNNFKEFLEIKNNENDINKFSKKYLSNFNEKIILESTGRHHFLPAIELSEKGFDVRVINPLISKKYFSSTIRKVKTDKQDSEILSNIALQEERLPATFNADRKDLEIRKKITLMGTLEKEGQRLRSIMSDYEKTKENIKIKLSKSEKDFKKLISKIKDIQTELGKEIVSEVRANNDISESVNRFKTIPGISDYVASIVVCFFDKNINNNSKQWIAFSGLDVSVKESGKWKGKGRLTKRGNPYLRKRLFQAAWGAVMNNEQFKKYYRSLRDQGRSYTESLLIISRKIVRIMFSLEKNGSCYNDEIIISSLTN